MTTSSIQRSCQVRVVLARLGRTAGKIMAMPPDQRAVFRDTLLGLHDEMAELHQLLAYREQESRKPVVDFLGYAHGAYMARDAEPVKVA